MIMDMSAITNAYKTAKRRLVLLDYDGTLMPLMPLPEQAKPTSEIRELLRKIGDDPNTACVIISGRQHEILDTWLGDLPLSFVAEHGALWRGPGVSWVRHATTEDASWKKVAGPLFETYAKLVPGSLLEEKTVALVFHYRNASSRDIDVKVPVIVEELRDVVRTSVTPLQLVEGDMVLEVMPLAVSKGGAAQEWQQKDSWDFVLAMGDDTTDESMFEVLATPAWTVKVGSGRTAARQRLETQQDVIRLLRMLVA